MKTGRERKAYRIRRIKQQQLLFKRQVKINRSLQRAVKLIDAYSEIRLLESQAAEVDQNLGRRLAG